jgi:hypothetical protein
VKPFDESFGMIEHLVWLGEAMADQSDVFQTSVCGQRHPNQEQMEVAKHYRMDIGRDFRVLRKGLPL